MRLIALDVNGTLSNPEPLRDLFAAAGAPESALDTWLASTLRDGFALTAAGSYAEYEAVAADTLAEVLAAAALPDDEREGARARILDAFGRLPVHDDVGPGLDEIRARGAAAVTLTNGSVEYAERLLERAGLGELVDAHYSVAEVGCWKPDRRVYQHLVEQRGAAGSTALIAAHPWDVDGAKRAGLAAGWLNRAELPYPASLEPPDAVGTTLAAVVDRLFSADAG